MSRIIRVLVAAMISVVAFGGILQGTSGQAATGTVTVQKYFCTYLDETLLVEAIDLNECMPGGGTFTFYLVGDESAEYQQLIVGGNGLGTITLPVGAYQMVEEETQTFFDLSVIAGEDTRLLIGNPAPAVQPTVPAPTVVPTAVSAQPTAVPPPPIGLPNTGTGADAGSGLLALALTTGAALAAGGSLAVRRNWRD
jgi:hypothetical protein